MQDCWQLVYFYISPPPPNRLHTIYKNENVPFLNCQKKTENIQQSTFGCFLWNLPRQNSIAVMSFCLLQVKVGYGRMNNISSLSKFSSILTPPFTSQCISLLPHSSPCPTFTHWTQNDVTAVLSCLNSFLLNRVKVYPLSTMTLLRVDCLTLIQLSVRSECYLLNNLT